MMRLRTKLLARISAQSSWSRAKSTKVTSSQHGDTPIDYQEGASSPSEPQEEEKLRARDPLVKNFFVGIVDKELLSFPEVIQREDMEKLQNEVLPIRNFFNEEIDPHAIDSTRSIPTTLVDAVKQLGLYGVNAPVTYGGKGLGFSASLMITEPENNSIDVALELLSHRAIVDLLVARGTPEQKQRFLPKLADGSLVGTEAIFEYNIADNDLFTTQADYNSDTKSWTIAGEKAFVVTGPLPTGSSHLFLVIAQTQRPNVKGDAARGTTIFLVDPTMDGVKLDEQHITIGSRGVQMRKVQFNQVRVPGSCVLGETHFGNEIAEVLLRSSRLRQSAIGLGMTKNILNNMSDYCINSKQCGVLLTDMEMIKAHLAKTACAVYAMESLIYYTAGLMDEFDAQDVALESAITKYFSLSECFKVATKYMDLLGPSSLHAGQTSDIFFRNAAQLYTQGESVDTLRLYIALSGLQHAGVLKNSTVHKSRNPLFYPGHIFSKFLQASNIDSPRTKMKLGENVHPSLEPAALCIEHSVARLEMSVELLLTRYGSQVIECHLEMQRLAEIVTAIYAMFASASRASRSYCIGLPLADHELLTATTICAAGRDLVKNLCTDIFNGKYINNDNNYQRLSKQLVKSKGYFAVHPLMYNF